VFEGCGTPKVTRGQTYGLIIGKHITFASWARYQALLKNAPALQLPHIAFGGPHCRATALAVVSLGVAQYQPDAEHFQVDTPSGVVTSTGCCQ
jgi:hypothetical protein